MAAPMESKMLPGGATGQGDGRRVVVSIDVGVRNFAVAVVAVRDWKRFDILRWTCEPVFQSAPGSEERFASTQGATDALLRYLEAQEWLDPLRASVSDVLVEQQGLNDARMFALSHVLYAYFRLRLPGATVSIVSPTLKMKLCKRLGFVPSQFARSRRTAQNKAAAVAACEALLRTDDVEVARGGAWVSAFASFPAKRDDLADCLLQALAHDLYTRRAAGNARRGPVRVDLFIPAAE